MTSYYYGTTGNNEYIYSGSDNLYAEGKEGNDSIKSSYRNDEIYGGKGNDSLYGGYGNDKLYGEDDHDYLDGGYGNDKLYGGEGHDTIYGGYGYDSIEGGYGNDYVDAGYGDDVVYGGYGYDTLYGDYGNDTLYGEYDNDVLSGGFGSDKLYGGEGNDTLTGFGGYDYGSYEPNAAQYGYDYDAKYEVDYLEGGKGADTFVLGDKWTAYYQDPGIYGAYSYAVIKDYDAYEGDKIQLYGDKSAYTLGTGYYSGTNGKLDTAIYYQGDLVGIVESVSNLSLNNFSYVNYTNQNPGGGY